MTTTFSIRFKKCLKEKNIKQAELARSTKITPSSISDWSKGKYTPKRDKLQITNKLPFFIFFISSLIILKTFNKK